MLECPQHKERVGFVKFVGVFFQVVKDNVDGLTERRGRRVAHLTGRTEQPTDLEHSPDKAETTAYGRTGVGVEERTWRLIRNLVAENIDDSLVDAAVKL